MEQRELRAQRKIVTALRASEEIIQEEIAELEKGTEYRLLQHIEKFIQFTKEEKAKNKRLIETMVEAREEGRLKYGKGRIIIKPKEEKE